MADPLTAVANEVAPAPSNFFDENAANTIFARYATNKNAAAATGETAKVAQNLYGLRRSQEQSQWERDRMERDKLLRSREDEQWDEKKQADSMRGEFLGSLIRELHPDDPDFNVKSVDFLSKAPAYIAKDPVVREILGGLSREADKAEAARVRTSDLKLKQQNTLASIKEKAKYNKVFGFLTEDDFKSLPLDETGQPDMVAAMALAKDREREFEREDYKAKSDINQKNRLEILDINKMDDQQKARARETQQFITQDREAFPRMTDALRAKVKKDGNMPYDPPEEILKTSPGYNDAKAWDKDLFKNEVNAAMKRDNPEDYIKLVPDLNDFGKDSRRRVWEYAHQNDDKARTPEVGQSTGSAPTQGNKKSLTPEGPSSQFKEAVVGGVTYRKYADGRVVKVTQ
jgi:hypothetical protein